MPIAIGAIDVGSNAIRLEVALIDDSGDMSIVKKLRREIRLGHDVFSDGFVHEKTVERTIQAFEKFSEVFDEYGVRHYRAVATSALREAKNQKNLIRRLLYQSEIFLDVISADEEGELIFRAIKNKVDIKNKNYLFVDIGGGSVEITFVKGGKFVSCKSFPIGTVRVLEHMAAHQMEQDDLPDVIAKCTDMVDYIQKILKTTKVSHMIGTGGNFECLGRLRKELFDQAYDGEFYKKELDEMTSDFFTYSPKERQEVYGLKRDRADVILPAALLIQKIMGLTKARKVEVPGVGLREGLLWELYDQLII